MPLPTIPHDKALHFVYGSVLAGVGSLHSVAVGAALCGIAAIGKEVHDRVTKRGVSDFMDTIATLAGGLPVLIPLALWRLGIL